MSVILEGIFKGFIQWVYSLCLEIVQYIANSLLDVFQMDLSYFRQVVPVTDDILDIIIAVGWALLLGNLVFQATKSMATGLGFEGEDPKLLFTRTFVFAFLLLASPQICEIGLGISAHVIQLLQIPTSVTVTIPDENNFSLGASWLLIIIIGFIIMWQFVKLCFEVAERYVVTAILVLMAPLAFGMGGSKNTEDIFKGWCRMFGSMCVMMVLNVIFLKLLISAMGYVPSGVAVLPWMLLIVGIARVARKADSIVARMGLNPAITGDGLGRGLPGMVAYAVVKGIGNSIAKAAGASVKHAKGSTTGGNSSGPRPNPRGSASPPPPPPSGGSGGPSASAGMGAQKGQQTRTYSTVTGGTFVSQQQGQETVHDTGVPSPEDGRMEGASRQSGQQGSGKTPTIHTHGTRRSSVPPEARAGTRTARVRTGSYTSAVGSDDKLSAGTLGRTGQPDSQQPVISHTHDHGKINKTSAAGTPQAGSTRISAVTPGRGTDAKAGTATHTSSRETMREHPPIQQDRTPKIPTPQGVGSVDKPDSRPSSTAAAHPSAGHPTHEIGGSSAPADSAPTRPPVGGRHYQDGGRTPVSGMAETQQPAGSRILSSGDMPLVGTAGKSIHAASGTPSGGADFSVGTAGSQTPPRKSRFSAGSADVSPVTAGIARPPSGGSPKAGQPSSGTAGTVPSTGQERPLVGRGTLQTGTAGTRRPSGMAQVRTERRTSPSATAGTVPQGTAKTPEVNRGTRRLKQGEAVPPAPGGQTTPAKNRKRRRKS